MRSFFVPLLLVGVMMVGVGCDRTPEKAEDLLTAIERTLPESVSSWRIVSPPTLYNQDTLFTYINGHAEVYLAYSFRRCLALRYEDESGLGLVVDVFEMASPEDAYGVFTHDQDGTEVNVGRGALFRYGWLSFWQGPFFVSITAEAEDEEAERAVLELARIIEAVIPSTGSPPEIVQRLPAEGLVARSVRYLYHPQILASHLYLGRDDAPFGLGAETRAALGRYDRHGETAYVLLVDYPDRDTAARARDAFASAFLDGLAEPVQRSDGWFSEALAPGREDSLIFVIRAGSRDLAAALPTEVSTPGTGGAS